MKILIVDDNPEMREFISHFIRPICENIYECGDGNEALEFYRKYEPDWVLMDWQMKKMDGISATEQIIEHFPQARICMITNFNDIFLKEEAFKAGAREFIKKSDLSLLTKILMN